MSLLEKGTEHLHSRISSLLLELCVSGLPPVHRETLQSFCDGAYFPARAACSSGQERRPSYPFYASYAHICIFACTREIVILIEES
jgi:hypothetical protein